MKRSTFKKLQKVNRALLDCLKSKKELIAERSEQLDPNNKANRQRQLTSHGKKNDGFEHRKSIETLDPPLLEE